jgi:hypothetical protein
MKALTSLAALTLALSFAGPAFAASQQCGMYGMTCAPMDKNVKYATKSKECGLYGMTCAPMDKTVKHTHGAKSKQCGMYGMNC